MIATVPASANEFIEQQLDALLLALEGVFDSDAMMIMGDLVGGVDDLIRGVVEGVRGRGTERDRLAVILTTDGGYIETVHRIVDTLRHHYDHIGFIIPNYAFSAGTVLAMSGDEIWMDYYSRLGPIDPQVQTDKGLLVPALGYLKKWEELLEKANNNKLTLAEAQLMIDGFDQAELYRYEQARELSITLLEQWLVKYKFKNWKITKTHQKVVTPEMRQERARGIGEELSNTDKWHSHGYGISMATLRNDLNLLIDDLDKEQERGWNVKQYYGLMIDYTSKLGHNSVIHAINKYVPFHTHAFAA